MIRISTLSVSSLVIALVAIPTGARADRQVELGVAAGGHVFASDTELGVLDEMDEPGPTSGVLLGARAGLALGRLALEGELVLVPTEDDVLGDGATVLGARVQGAFHLMTGKVRPFVLVGAGLLAIRGGAPQLDDDVDPALHWGAGVKIALTPRIDLRLDLRHLIVPDRATAGATHDVEAATGLAFRFGGAPPRRPRPVAVVEPAPAPVAPGDRDDDGLADDVDGCIAEPEDHDGVDDRDGCPDLDDDADGLVDAVDECPADPEVVNQWRDDDGCPDQVIAGLDGIQFERNSWRITRGSRATLDHAYDVLAANPEVIVEVAGHTSSDGDHDANVTLSLRRAEAVRDYLIERGIAAGRVTAAGYGPDQPVADESTAEGRARNRRIELRILGTIHR